MREGPRDRDALLLAAGQDIRIAVGAITEPHGREQLVDARGRRRGRHPVQLQHEPHVVGHVQRRHEVERLVDEADMRAPEQRAVALGQSGQIDARDGHGTGIRRIDAADQVQQRRLARAAPAPQGHGLAARDVQVDPVEHDVLALAFAKATAQAAEANFHGGVRAHIHSTLFYGV